jgi:predicted GIY-YIG superfamily endonuclease
MARKTGPWFCYILECCDGSFYVGAASDLVQRVKRHNWGVGSRYTAARRPVRLAWWEEHPDERGARGREAELKGWRK